jgi:hypothetical protein
MIQFTSLVVITYTKQKEMMIMIRKTVMAVEPLDATSIIGTYEHNGSQDHSETYAKQQEQKESKQRQLKNQIFMEISALPNLGHNINMYV